MDASQITGIEERHLEGKALKEIYTGILPNKTDRPVCTQYISRNYKHHMEALKKTFDCGDGTPSLNLRHEAADILMKATEHRLKNEKATDAMFLSYVDDGQGDPRFLASLARFLTKQYGGDTISTANLHATAGATNGLSLALTLLLEKGSPVFAEEPLFFLATGLIEETSMVCQPVAMDNQGLSAEDLEKKVENWRRCRQESQRQTPEGRMYRGAVYAVPVYHNPTGICYSEDRCRQLVGIARKYSLLIICDDVYNFLHHTGDKPPKRLLTYDRQDDPHYAGSVLSNGSFSKYLAPGVRVGWLEGLEKVINHIKYSIHTSGGGPINHLGSGFLTSAMELGLLEPFVERLKRVYCKRLSLFYKYLEEHLPKGCTFSRPQGGYFIWVELPEGTDSTVIMDKAKTEYNVVVYDGGRFSNLNGFSNCVRLSVSNVEEEQIELGLKAFCHCLRKHTGIQ